MARPRVFLSSTFYDLRQIREELERFVISMGYEAVRHETGAIPYSATQPLEDSAYGEVDRCDMLVTVVGGRFGSESSDGSGYSITQREIKRALEKNVQVFIFVEHAVHAELETFRLNKDNPSVKYASANNRKIFEFLGELYALPWNNPITPFQTGNDITSFLRSQWAGLFQRFLQQQSRMTEVQMLEQMRAVTGTLKQLVDALSRDQTDVIRSIVVTNHPAFSSFAIRTDTRYRVFFSNRAELDSWLESLNFLPCKYDDYALGSVYEWLRENKRYGRQNLRLKHEIFDGDGRLLPFSESGWDEEWLALDDDIPF